MQGDYFWIVSHSNLNSFGPTSPTPLFYYFEHVLNGNGQKRIDAALLIADQSNHCWNLFRCLTVYLFQGLCWNCGTQEYYFCSLLGNQLWTYNWYHFWHIEAKLEYPIIVSKIHPKFPVNLDAAFSDWEFIYLIKGREYYKIPIFKFPVVLKLILI